MLNFYWVCSGFNVKSYDSGFPNQTLRSIAELSTALGEPLITVYRAQRENNYLLF